MTSMNNWKAEVSIDDYDCPMKLNNPDNNHCIGDECMAWVWAPKDVQEITISSTGTPPDPHDWEQVKYNSGLYTFRRRYPLGGCGLRNLPN